MAYVLAFACGLHVYYPQQLRREWRPLPQEQGTIHLPEATALIVGIGGIGTEAARLCAAFGVKVIGVDARRRERPRGVSELHAPDALKAGELSGAALDVFEEEPLPPDHPLWTIPGVIITPHVAGNGPYLDERRFEIILENCRRFLAGEPLRNIVDKANWF